MLGTDSNVLVRMAIPDAAAESRRQKAEGRRQKAESREQNDVILRREDAEGSQNTKVSF
jgi:hypothetical protein